MAALAPASSPEKLVEAPRPGAAGLLHWWASALALFRRHFAWPKLVIVRC